MKRYAVVFLLLICAACSKKAPEPAKADQSKGVEAPQPTLTGSPEGYVNSLQKDVHKAQDVRDKANTVIQGQGKELEKSMQEAEQ